MMVVHKVLLYVTKWDTEGAVSIVCLRLEDPLNLTGLRTYWTYLDTWTLLDPVPEVGDADNCWVLMLKCGRSVMLKHLHSI